MKLLQIMMLTLFFIPVTSCLLFVISPVDTMILNESLFQPDLMALKTMSIPAASLYRPGVNVLLLRKTDKAVIGGEIPVICVPARQLTLCAAAIDLLSFSADPGRIWNNFNRRGDCLRLPCGEEHGCINDICPFAIGINRWIRRV